MIGAPLLHSASTASEHRQQASLQCVCKIIIIQAAHTFLSLPKFIVSVQMVSQLQLTNAASQYFLEKANLKSNLSKNAGR